MRQCSIDLDNPSNASRSASSAESQRTRFDEIDGELASQTARLCMRIGANPTQRPKRDILRRASQLIVGRYQGRSANLLSNEATALRPATSRHPIVAVAPPLALPI